MIFGLSNGSRVLSGMFIHHGTELIGSLFLQRHRDVHVHVHRDADILMAQPLLDDLRMLPELEQQCRAGVTQVVDAERLGHPIAARDALVPVSQV